MISLRHHIEALPAAFGSEQIQASMALFAPLQPAIDEAAVLRDISYGPDPRHLADIFGAGDPQALRPIVIFIHGGGFIGGDKGGPNRPFYSNVGSWAARQGWLGIVATYRLAPEHCWPAGSEDIDRLVRWLKSDATAFGGDPARIVLMGQSAGAAHVAGYVGGAAFAEVAQRSLAGAIMLSGLYDPASADRNAFQAAYYGTDEALLPQYSTLEGLAQTALPCLYTVAERDPADFQRQAALLVSRRVAQTGQWPNLALLEGHNHISPVHQINCAGDDLGPRLAKFVNDLGHCSA